MISINNRAERIDELLDKMAEVIQLDKTKYERMKQAYEAVKVLIEADEIFFKPHKFDVYPHGSVRILTTVKPIGSDEFDLDIVIHLIMDWQLHKPLKIYNELKRVLEIRYKDKLELKNRCLRLNYSGDFHMDILPGIQENPFDNNRILVPERMLGTWVSSNPKGYAEWFITKANLVKESLLEKALLRSEKLPNDDFSRKKPLQRAVQLIKRYRDEYFQKDDTYKTSSIILTTIAGQFYNGEDSIFSTVDGIISSIIKQTNQISRLKIFNPVNPAEDFTDKWDKEPQYYTEFKKFSIHLYNQWQKLKEENHVNTEEQIFKGLFGESIYNKGLALQNEYFNKSTSHDPYDGLRKLAQPASVGHKMWLNS